MDSVISALAAAAPQLGQLGVLVVVLGLLIRREGQTNDRHATELQRVNTARDAELTNLRQQVTALRGQLDELNRKLDEERAARRRAEDSASLRQTSAWQQIASEGGPEWPAG